MDLLWFYHSIKQIRYHDTRLNLNVVFFLAITSFDSSFSFYNLVTSGTDKNKFNHVAQQVSVVCTNQWPNISLELE